ncbi:MAG: T9SS type A sorting domain-containing protein [Bacteroidales bacterium]|nr:T9SS type A sorting domain-containing protein [Bacteroidales bacterium]
MGKKFFIAKGVFLCCILANLNATTYYLSNNGSNDNNGISPNTAWQTLAQLNSQALNPGDSVLFEAGGIWRGTLQIKKSGIKEAPIVYSRYGSGKNPAIYGSRLSEGWSKTSVPNVWQANTEMNNISQEYFPGRIFFVKNNTVSWGKLRPYDAGFSNLANDYDYTVSGSVHYIYSQSDPNSQYDAVEIAQRDFCIQTNRISYIHIIGIDMHYARLSGFFAGYPEYRGVEGLVFKDCNIGYFGDRGSGYAYGIEIWHSNSLIENCNFSDCGRRAISLNLYTADFPAGQERVVDNLIIRNNTFKRGYHTTGLDLACNRGAGDTIRNIYYYNNIHDDSEHQVIGDRETSNQAFIYTVGGDYVNNIVLANNIFINATGTNILVMGCDTVRMWHNTIVGHNPNITDHPYGNVAIHGTDNLDYRNNILYDNLADNNLYNYGLHSWSKVTNYFERDYNLYYSENPKTDRCFTSIYVESENRNYAYSTAVWQNYLNKFTDFDQHSPVPQNPQFIDYENHDFRLADSSPIKTAGTVLPHIKVVDPYGKADFINKFDIGGNLRGTPPSIGAYEYGAAAPGKTNFGLMFVPNPASDFVSLFVDEKLSGNTYTVKLYSMSGQLVNRFSVYIDDSATLPVADIASGVYLVEMSSNNTTIQKKLIIAR